MTTDTAEPTTATPTAEPTSGGDEPTINLPEPSASAPAPKAEPTPEEIAAEETRRAGLSQEERDAEDAARAAEQAKDKPVVAPEKYEPFKMPEGVELNTEVMTEFEGLAKELNLSQESAQKVADLGAKLSQRWAGQQQDAIIAAQKEWTQQSLADKEFGGEKLKENIGVAERAIKEFTTPEYRKLLRDSGLSQHPEVIRTFFRIGKTIKPDTTQPAGGGNNGARDNSDEARAARLYSSSKPAA